MPGGTTIVDRLKTIKPYELLIFFVLIILLALSLVSIPFVITNGSTRQAADGAERK